MREEMDCDIEMRILRDAEAERKIDERRDGERSDAGPSSAALWLKANDRAWPLRSVRVLDISQGGLSFEAEEPLPVGSKLEMNVNTPVKNGIIAVAEVRYTIRWAGSYRVGVRFLRISESDRKLLDGRTFRDASCERTKRHNSRRSSQSWWEWENEPY